MKTALTSLEFSNLIVQDDFALKTQRQIVKDFNSVGQDFESKFSENALVVQDILLEIQSHLIALMRQGETILLRLLYQIDIPEKDFLSLVGNSNMVIKLSELILQREAYKVYLRSQF